MADHSVFSTASRTQSVQMDADLHAELLLAFWASIGFKPCDFMTMGTNEKPTGWLCRVLGRMTHPA